MLNLRLLTLTALLGLAACAAPGGPAVLASRAEPVAQLVALEQLAVPEGVDPALWGQLKEALATALAEAPPRGGSDAPVTDASASVLTYDNSTTVLAWDYACQGDYDQNGEVGISDLTPIAQNFGEVSGGGPFPRASIESVVDGDGNGEIGIADITPIGQNFGRIVLGYRLHRSADPGTDYPAGNADPSTTAYFKTILLADAVGAPTLERLTFSFTVGAVTPGEWFWVRPGHGASEGTPSNMVEVEALGDGTPVAALTADVTSGPAPLDVSFDASGSTDADGTIVSYSWDFEGDGTADLDSGTDATVTRNYPGDGTFEAVVTVTDNDGLADTASLTIVVGSGVNALPIAAIEADVTSGPAPLDVHLSAAGSVDPDGSITIYQWDSNGDGVIDVTGAGNALFTTYSAPGGYDATVYVTDNDWAVDSASVHIVVGGLENADPTIELSGSPLTGEPPHEATFSIFAGDVDGSIAAYEVDWDGDGTYDETVATPESFTHTFDTGEHYVWARVTDNDGASATDFVRLLVAPAGFNFPPVATFSADPISGDHPLTVNFDSAASYDPDGLIAFRSWDFQGDGSVELANHLAPTFTYEVAGVYHPILLVRDNAGEETTFTLDITVTGEGWYTFPIDPSGPGPVHSSAVIADGVPVVAYSGASDGELWFSRATDPLGRSWSDPIGLGSTGPTGKDLSLAIIDGQIGLAYQRAISATEGELRYRESLDAAGVEWGASTPVSGIGDEVFGSAPVLLDVEDQPYIMHAGSDGLGFTVTRRNGAGIWSTTEEAHLYSFGLHGTMVAGKPAASFDSAGTLYGNRATDFPGADWPAPSVVGAASGGPTSILDVGGLAGVFWIHRVSNTLNFRRATTDDAHTWGPVATLDDSLVNNGALSSTFIGGKPAVALNYGRLYYYTATSATGSTWNPREQIPFVNAASTSDLTLLRVGADQPLVVFHQFGTDDLLCAVYLLAGDL